MHRFIRALGALLVLLHPATAQVEVAPTDRIVLQDGKQLLGQVVFEDPSEIVLRQKTSLQHIPIREVSEVHASLRELPIALEKQLGLAAEDVAAHLDLASWMQEHGLPFQAKLLRWRVLLLSPDDESAHLALGHKRVAGSWRVPVGSSWQKLPRALEAHAKWSKAWEFETTHFALRSNMPLRDILDAAFDLEYTYVQFQSLFGRALKLHRSRFKIGVWLHGDKKSFVDPDNNAKGHYQSRDRRLYVDGTNPDWRSVLIHETVHGIVDFTAALTQSGKGEVPPWLHEGLAIYMEPHHSDGSYSDDPRDIGASGTQRWMLRLHAQAKKPFSLKAILSMAAGDYALQQRTELRYAQSYSLLDFSLNAEDGLYRENFLGYMREVFEGKSSGSRYRKALGLRDKAIEEAWINYVKGI